MVQFLTVADKINKEDLVDDEDDEFMIGIGGYGDSGTGMGGGGTGNIGKKKNVVLIGFIRRICKLLFNEILPVFVFDGVSNVYFFTQRINLLVPFCLLHTNILYVIQPHTHTLIYVNHFFIHIKW